MGRAASSATAMGAVSTSAGTNPRRCEEKQKNENDCVYVCVYIYTYIYIFTYMMHINKYILIYSDSDGDRLYFGRDKPQAAAKKERKRVRVKG